MAFSPNWFFQRLITHFFAALSNSAHCSWNFSAASAEGMFPIGSSRRQISPTVFPPPTCLSTQAICSSENHSFGVGTLSALAGNIPKIWYSVRSNCRD